MAHSKPEMASALLFIVLCLAGVPASSGEESVIGVVPLPAEINIGEGGFTSSGEVKLFLVDPCCDKWERSAQIFADKTRDRRGVNVKVLAAVPRGIDKPGKGAIYAGPDLTALGPRPLGLPEGLPREEGYRIEIADDNVLITAATPHGFHNALMTLLQLGGDNRGIDWPCMTIVDYPRFGWRGMLIDTSRSFYPPDVVKKYVDVLSELKINVLHWHIVDDHGWRIESKAFPKLHEVGGTIAFQNEKKQKALDNHGWGRDGRGYYTRDEIREIVSYASDRFVMVVPEIDIPGHSSAMLASYPELSCSGEPVPVRSKPGIYKTALCPGKEEVYEFLDELFADIGELFPSPYVHIGSDEVLAADWLDYPGNIKLMEEHGYAGREGLQSYFVDRVSEILEGRGKTMIAWDEVTHYAPPGTVIQAWRLHSLAADAARDGNDSIVSPVTHCYIDYPQLSFTLKNLYHFEPVPEGLAPELRHHILGGEVNLWGERVTMDNVDRKAFPRAVAHAEVMWTPADKRDWDGFVRRLSELKPGMKSRGVEFGITWRDILLLP